ncbi:MAG: DUF4136 domain-containing protein [Deltaproteobacteria bacterium]|nr:DUF4136 domain-containing protein [Deltaproteobacteria bacterium]MBW2418737.1 DUF4136 domain-containing protein [Deltaproteobacteria bacterium]
MRHTLLVVVAVHALACAGTLIAPRVRVEMPAEAVQVLEGYHTWGWLPGAEPADSTAAALHAAITEQIEDSLGSRGFEHTTGLADFYVTYRFSLRSRTAAQGASGAPVIVSTQSYQPSFVIESTATPVPSSEDLRLRIVAAAPDGRVLWKARSTRRVHQWRDRSLEAFVATLFSQFPARVPHEHPGDPAPGSPPGTDTDLARH